MKTFFKKNIKLITLIFIISFIILIQILPIMINKEIIYPQGGDSSSHLWMSKTIIETGSNKDILYPTSFHILLSALYLITDISIIKIFIYITPFIFCLLLSSLYLLVRKFTNEKSAIFTVFIMALISYHPQWYLRDATIVNVLAVFFFMPLIFLYLYKYFIYNRFSYLLISIILFINNGILHTVGFMYSFVIILSSLFIAMLLLKNIGRKKILAIFLIFLIIGLLNPYRIIISYIAPIFLQNIQLQSNENSLQKNNEITGIQIVPPKNFTDFKNYINNFIWLLFILSVPFIYKYYKNSNKKILFLILFIAFVFLFFGARTKFGVETERFTRDFVLILIILTSFFIKVISKNYYKKLILSILLIISIFLYIPKTLANYVHYTPELKYIDYQAITWLDNQFPNTHKNILLSPTLKGNQIPGPFVFIFAENKNINFLPSDCFSDILYKPKINLSRKFYKINDVDFIYYRNKPLGWIPIKCNFEFDKSLENTDFLTKINFFKQDSIIIKIFKVEKDKL